MLTSDTLLCYHERAVRTLYKGIGIDLRVLTSNIAASTKSFFSGSLYNY